jgi:penicillin-insensitive murein endopeptidase
VTAQPVCTSQHRCFETGEEVKLGAKHRATYLLVVGVSLCAAIVRWGNTIAIALESHTPSRSVGTKTRGRLERGKRLPTSGPNFVVYSHLGALLGRNSVHSTIRDIVLEAYHEAERTAPGVTFVYGETGWPSGGRFRPHRTHQNGLSLDFMVPVRDVHGLPSRLPTLPWLRFGYDVEFDSTGRAGQIRIDYAAVAAHLAALERAARRHGSAIELVILAPELERVLKAEPQRRVLVRELPFMQGRPWIRHDEHYHVDFTPPAASRNR